MLLSSCPVQWCGSCPPRPIAVLASTAVMSCAVHCQVCGVWVVCVSVLFVWWGILCLLPPVVVVGGAVVDGGVAWRMVGGMVSEGRLCCWPPRLVCGVPLLFVWWSR